VYLVSLVDHLDTYFILYSFSTPVIPYRWSDFHYFRLLFRWTALQSTLQQLDTSTETYNTFTPLSPLLIRTMYYSNILLVAVALFNVHSFAAPVPEANFNLGEPPTMSQQLFSFAQQLILYS
jgi:hypothetical protein